MGRRIVGSCGFYTWRMLRGGEVKVTGFNRLEFPICLVASF